MAPRSRENAIVLPLPEGRSFTTPRYPNRVHSTISSDRLSWSATFTRTLKSAPSSNDSASSVISVGDPMAAKAYTIESFANLVGHS
jgi:hypothetical protein